jgi:nickel/cobalt transporter (NicO) family protein
MIWQIFIGSLVLSLIHGSIPNHWVPLIAIGKAEKWTTKETMLATIITGFAHTLSTVLIGIVVGFIGVRIAAFYETIVWYIAPVILMTIGLLYVIIDRFGHQHVHGHSPDCSNSSTAKSLSKRSLLLSLSLAMFLTPCIEIEAYYFQAGLI